LVTSMMAPPRSIAACPTFVRQVDFSTSIGLLLNDPGCRAPALTCSIVPQTGPSAGGVPVSIARPRARPSPHHLRSREQRRPTPGVPEEDLLLRANLSPLDEAPQAGERLAGVDRIQDQPRRPRCQ